MSSIVYQSKKSLTHHRLFKGLPAYFGGKRKLLPWIFGHLAQHIPPSQWPSLRFLDLFMGGGSVSLFAKAQGFAAVLSNDLSPRCEIIANALLANHHQPLTRTDLLQFVQNTVEFDHPGSIETELSTSVFSTRHAQWLDRVRGWADVQDNPTKAALWRLMLWHLAHRFVCFPTSLGSSNRPFAEALDGMRSWDELNPKRYTDGSLNELLKPATKQIVTVRRNLNHSIFAGGPTTFSRLDALDCLQQTPADVVFMDPPYAGTLSYESKLKVLDEILGVQTPMQTSTFTHATEDLHQLCEAAQNVPNWILTYGNHQLTLENLVALVKEHAGDRTVVGFAKSYKHLSHVSQRTQNQELLVLALNG